MDFNNCVPSLDNYVAKYMDENGCSFEEACEELHLCREDFMNKEKFDA
ncbi:MAG: hypothetical protein PUE01_13740 [Clostridiaceae bacterium]|nr:hypothetical protein [Clostridiaceae bacterium]